MQLVVPRLGTEVRPAMEHANEAEKLFRQMQLLAPYKEHFWQKAAFEPCWEILFCSTVL